MYQILSNVTEPVLKIDGFKNTDAILDSYITGNRLLVRFSVFIHWTLQEHLRYEQYSFRSPNSKGHVITLGP